MAKLHVHFHQVRREIKDTDIKRHIMSGSTHNIVSLLYQIQGDVRWVEQFGDSIYFRSFFLNIRNPADNMIVFEVMNNDRKMAEKFDKYLVGKVGELDLVHSQPVAKPKGVGK